MTGQTGENLAQALSPRTDGPALARRAPRRSGPGRRREAEPDPASDNRVARAVESWLRKRWASTSIRCCAERISSSRESIWRTAAGICCGSGRVICASTRPCERMDEPLPGLRAERRHRWGGGVYASVLEDGKSAVGDPVEGERAAPRKPEPSLSRRSPPPRRRRAGSRGLRPRPRRFHRPLPRAHPHTQVPGSGLSRGSLPGHASRGCLHGRRPERLGERHGNRGYVLHQTLLAYAERPPAVRTP